MKARFWFGLLMAAFTIAVIAVLLYFYHKPVKGKAVLGQAAFDLGANLVVGFGTWCLGAKMKALLCL